MQKMEKAPSCRCEHLGFWKQEPCVQVAPERKGCPLWKVPIEVNGKGLLSCKLPWLPIESRGESFYLS